MTGMPTSRIRSVVLGFAAIGALLMALITVVAEKTNQTMAVMVALPGLICHLLITGGHGGTDFQETVGSCVAVAINACLGAAFFLLINALLRHLDRKRLGQSQ